MENRIPHSSVDKNQWKAHFPWFLWKIKFHRIFGKFPINYGLLAVDVFIPNRFCLPHWCKTRFFWLQKYLFEKNYCFFKKGKRLRIEFMNTKMGFASVCFLRYVGIFKIILFKANEAQQIENPTQNLKFQVQLSQAKQVFQWRHLWAKRANDSLRSYASTNPPLKMNLKKWLKLQ